MTSRIAIVGMACRYADAPSPRALWETVLAQRRAFRRLPAERLNAADYFAADRSAPDRVYAWQAAVLEGYSFDRARFRVALDSFRSTDVAHWLALDVAAAALEDAGFPEGRGLPRAETGVIVGNTLTGEMSRSSLLRLRWPYVRRQVAAGLDAERWPAEKQQDFLDRLERSFKAPFAPIGDESLAGGLANTIAGRICNHFDLQGGGFVVDGACCSSLLAVAQACSALTAGEIDAALVGGVDISLDPFELIGFAKVGALAPGEMRVYDKRSVGFIPGEGCGFVVLMREDDARRRDLPVRATVAGWGIASDGTGGITRPEAKGERRALDRAYLRAGFAAGTVPLFEGHGTGTTVGDAVELEVLSAIRRDWGATTRAAVGSVKANIGHTKAAAGVAGLIKATLALERSIIPPTTGCEDPHATLEGERAMLRAPREPEPWPDAPLRAGVSAFGFGGINVHVALERQAPQRTRALAGSDCRLARSPQDAEVFLFDASDTAQLDERLARLQTRADQLSSAELTDAACAASASLTGAPLRAAVVASTPSELQGRLRALRELLAAGPQRLIDGQRGLFLGARGHAARVGFLFPGQGSPARRDGGAWGRRFASVQEIYRSLDLPEGDGVATEVAQPAIVAASRAALAVLQGLGIRGDVALGHSLGELSALAFAGAVDETRLFDIVRARARAMREHTRGNGAMVSIGAEAGQVSSILAPGVVIAALNGPRLTVISGPADSVEQVAAKARERGWSTVALAVSHAFHSPMMREPAVAFAARLREHSFAPPDGRMISTITGHRLAAGDDVRALLAQQLHAPVRFHQALDELAREASLLIEVGPGRALTTIASSWCAVPVIATDACGASLAGVLHAVAACFVSGVEVNPSRLFEDRFARPIDLSRPFSFLANPCEQAPAIDLPQAPRPAVAAPAAAIDPVTAPLTAVREALIARTALPPEAITDGTRLLDDLHLSSIAIGELIGAVTRRLGLPAPKAPSDFAHATVAQLAAAIEDLARGRALRPPTSDSAIPAGVGPWMRDFVLELDPQPRPPAVGAAQPGRWMVVGEGRLASALRSQLPEVGGEGVAYLAEPLDVAALVEATRHALRLREGGRFVLVQHDPPAAGWARTLKLERPDLAVCVVTVPRTDAAAAWIVAEAAATTSYSEAVYDGAGARHVPRWRLATTHRTPVALGPADTIVVTGGGKGIGAACATALATQTGAGLILIGRNDPRRDAELAETLGELDARKIRWKYRACDINDGAALRRALAGESGISAVIHSAGINQPRAIAELDVAAVTDTVAVKVDGLRNLLAIVEPARLKALITFGSIIAASGLQGEAHYALANGLLAQATETFQLQHPHCRCLAIQWSAWSGVGMAERLGRLESLRAAGVEPLPREAATRHFLDLLGRPPAATTVTVTGRFGNPPTLFLEGQSLPLLRFLEKPRLHIPGVELIADAEISIGTDPYLQDHVVDGAALMPAVASLEAMAQVATALTGARVAWFEKLELRQPLIVPTDGRATLRAAALAEGSRVTVVLRSSTTDFAADHVRGICRLDAAPAFGPPIRMSGGSAPDVDRDLYGALLFQRGRFRRLADYRALSAWGCDADFVPLVDKRWFSDFLPQERLTGDLGARDATMHALQPCVPNRTLLPVAVERLVPGVDKAPARVVARERLRRGTRFIYDVQVLAADGERIEEWLGLELEMVAGNDRRDWPVSLVPYYLERKLADAGIAEARAAVASGPVPRLARTTNIVRALFDTAEWRHTNGRLQVQGGEISVSHTDSWTVGVRSRDPIGCDVEAATERSPSVWLELLGDDALALAARLSQEAQEPAAIASTRVWSAREALKKLGLDGVAQLHLASGSADGWVEFASGDARCWSWVAPAIEGKPFAFAFAWRPTHARL